MSCEGKVRHEDLEAALWELENIRGSASIWDKEKAPVRAYPCKRCGGYHLTSMRLNVPVESEDR